MADTKAPAEKAKTKKDSDSALGTGRFPHPEMTEAEQEQRDYAVQFAEDTLNEEVEAGKAALDSIVGQNEAQTAKVAETQAQTEKFKKEQGIQAPQTHTKP
jgi:hypothetical protein